MIGIRIDALNPAVDPSREHKLPAMKDGLTVMLTVGQILDLVIDSAPGALDTLNELAAALGDDENFAATVLAALAARVEKAQNLADLADVETARGNLGATEIGDALFTAEDAKTARSNIGAIGYEAQTLTLAQQAQARANISVPLKGHLHGLTLSNNSTDSDHDIDIAAGEAASDDTSDPALIVVAALTKRLDTEFVAGTGNGGMVAGEALPTSGTVHVWAIMQEDGTADVCFNNNASSGLSPTLPTDYVYKRRIGSLRTDSSANIVAFRQVGDVFRLAAGVVDRNSTSGASSIHVALSTPGGITTFPLLGIDASATANNVAHDFYLGDGAETTATVKVMGFARYGTNYAASDTALIQGMFATNTSSQIRYTLTISGGSLTTCTITTYGWIDHRGRMA